MPEICCSLVGGAPSIPPGNCLRILLLRTQFSLLLNFSVFMMVALNESHQNVLEWHLLERKAWKCNKQLVLYISFLIKSLIGLNVQFLLQQQCSSHSCCLFWSFHLHIPDLHFCITSHYSSFTYECLLQCNPEQPWSAPWSVSHNTGYRIQDLNLQKNIQIIKY